MTSTEEVRWPTRYTVQLQLEPSGRTVEVRVITFLGELKAAAVAALREVRLDPDTRISTIAITCVEKDYEIDREHDLIDYWGME